MGQMTEDRNSAAREANNLGNAAAKPSPNNNKKGRKAFIILGVTIGVGLLAFVGYIIINLGQETTDNAQVDADVVPLAAKTGGQVVKVMVVDNQRVKKGDPILKIDDTDHVARVSQAQGELEMAIAQLQSAQAQEQIIGASATGGLNSARALVSGSSQAVSSAEAQVQAARAALDRALTDASRAELELNRARELKAAEAVPQERLDNAESAFESAQATVTQARASLSAAEEQKRVAESRVVEAEGKLAQSSPVDAQVAAARAQTELAKGRVRAAEAAVELAKNQLAYTTVVAPSDGIVSNLSVTEGQIISPGQPIAELVSSDSYVVANFKETQIGRMRPGDRAEITIDAFPGQVFNGKVESISGGTGARFSLLPADNATGNFVKVVQRVPVRIRWLSRPDDLHLPAGLSVVVKVFVGSGSEKKEAGS
jgi:membrane fusion protein (multidrug efflux system)